MRTDDEIAREVNRLIAEKHELLRELEHDGCDKKKFKKDHDKLQSQIEALTNERLGLQHQRLQERVKNAINNKRKLTRKVNEFKKENRSKAGRKINPNSDSSLILQALQDPGLDSEQKVIARIIELKPGSDAKKLKNKVRVIVSNIKNGKGDRYKAYSFDKDKYLVVER